MAVALEVLLSRGGGGAEICVTLPMSGEAKPPSPPSRYRNIHHALYFEKIHLETAW